MTVLYEICGSLWRSTKRAVATGRQFHADDVSSLLHETLASGTMVAVVTSAINSLTRTPSVKSLSEASLFLPDEPRYFIELRDLASDTPETTRTVETLDNFYSHVDAAREALENIIAQDADAKASRLPALALQWQRLCGLAVTSITTVEGLADDLGVGRDVRTPELLLILTSAQIGAVPCLDSSGLLAVPHWLQRRRRLRTPVRFPVDIVSDLSADVAMAVDISPCGIGIRSHNKFREGDTVTMRIPDGRILAGVVAWRHGDRSGIAFDEVLAQEDPLLGVSYRDVHEAG